MPKCIFDISQFRAGFAQVRAGLQVIEDQLVCKLAASGSAYWDPAKKGSEITLSNSDKTATMASVSTTGGQVLSVTGHSSGKYYVEFKFDSGTDWTFGIQTSASSLDGGYPGDGYGGVGYYGVDGSVFYGSTIFTGPTFGPGDTVSVAIDIQAGSNTSLWLAVNGTYLNSGDPAAGTGAISTTITGDTFYLAAASFVANDVCTLRTQSGDFNYSVPAGFSAWG